MPSRVSLTPLEETQFQNWYGGFQKGGGEYAGWGPDHPENSYDYRAAFRAGAKPWLDKHNNVWMWPEEFHDNYNQQVTGSLPDEYDTQHVMPSPKQTLVEALMQKLKGRR